MICVLSSVGSDSSLPNASERTMGIKIGINPIGWSNDDMVELGDDIPLEQCLREARSAGYEGVELGRKFPRTAAELRPILNEHGLELISGWYSGALVGGTVGQEIAAIEAHLALLSELGCTILIYADVTGGIVQDRSAGLSRRPTLGTGDWPDFGARLTELAEHLRSRGVAMAYHHHMGHVVQSEADIDLLMGATGEAVGLLLDTGHLTYAGGDVGAVARRHGRRIRHVHCKDIRATALESALGRDSSFAEATLMGVFTVPGDGCVDYPGLFTELRAVDYDGWLVVEAEQDPAVANPRKYAEMGYGNLTATARAAGLL